MSLQSTSARLACWQDSSPEGTAARALCRAHRSQGLSNEGTACFSSPLAFLETSRHGIPARNLVPKCLGHQPNALVTQGSGEGSSSGGKWPCGADGMSLGAVTWAALDSRRDAHLGPGSRGEGSGHWG